MTTQPSMTAGSTLADVVATLEQTEGDALDALTIERAVLGLFFTGVKLSDGSGGLCATPIKTIPEAVCCPSSASAMPFPGKLRGRPVRGCLHEALSTGGLRRGLGVAVVNALAMRAWRTAPPPELELVRGVDALDTLSLKDFGRVVVIGALVPYLRALKRDKADFRVLEKDPATLRPDEMPFYAPAESAPEEVPKADLLIITGTTLINDSLDGLLALARSEAKVVLVGPTVPLMPAPFFKRGVDVLGGVMVGDSDGLLDLLAEGGSGYHFFGRHAERVVARKRL